MAQANSASRTAAKRLKCGQKVHFRKLSQATSIAQGKAIRMSAGRNPFTTRKTSANPSWNFADTLMW